MFDRRALLKLLGISAVAPAVMKDIVSKSVEETVEESKHIFTYSLREDDTVSVSVGPRNHVHLIKGQGQLNTQGAKICFTSIDTDSLFISPDGGSITWETPIDWSFKLSRGDLDTVTPEQPTELTMGFMGHTPVHTLVDFLRAHQAVFVTASFEDGYTWDFGWFMYETLEFAIDDGIFSTSGRCVPKYPF